MPVVRPENGRTIFQAVLIIVLAAGVIGMWKNNEDLAGLKSDIRNVSERLEYLGISFDGRLRSIETEMMSRPTRPRQ